MIPNDFGGPFDAGGHDGDTKGHGFEDHHRHSFAEEAREDHDIEFTKGRRDIVGEADPIQVSADSQLVDVAMDLNLVVDAFKAADDVELEWSTSFVDNSVFMEASDGFDEDFHSLTWAKEGDHSHSPSGLIETRAWIDGGLIGNTIADGDDFFPGPATAEHFASERFGDSNDLIAIAERPAFHPVIDPVEQTPCRIAGGGRMDMIDPWNIAALRDHGGHHRSAWCMRVQQLVTGLLDAFDQGGDDRKVEARTHGEGANAIASETGMRRELSRFEAGKIRANAEIGEFVAEQLLNPFGTRKMLSIDQVQDLHLAGGDPLSLSRSRKSNGEGGWNCGQVGDWELRGTHGSVPMVGSVGFCDLGTADAQYHLASLGYVLALGVGSEFSMHPVFHSAILLTTTAGLAVVLSVPIAIGWTKLHGSLGRWGLAAIWSLLCVPLYVQAAAWSAGFGALGFWRLTSSHPIWSQVFNHLAVVWIHAMGLLPFTSLILAIGLARVEPTTERLASLDGDWRSLFRHAWWPALRRWGPIAWLYGAMTMHSDMLVTNLFRVPTLTEQAYLDLSLGSPTTLSMFGSMLPACLFAMGLAWLLNRQLQSGSNERESLRPASEEVNLPRVAGWGWLVSGNGIVFVAVWMPLFSLLIKAGWEVERRQDQSEVGWSLVRFIESWSGLPAFVGEMKWTLVLASSSAGVAMAIACGVVLASFLTKRPWWMAWGLLLCCLACPGPTVNLACKRILESLPVALSDWILDRTLLAPIMALQFRAVPLIAIPLLLLAMRWRQRNDLLHRADGDSAWNQGVEFLRLHRGWLAVLGLLAWSVAASDLASYLLLLPPSVSTLAMRIFEFLHYGVRYREAGLSLFLMLIGMGVGILIVKLVPGRMMR